MDWLYALMVVLGVGATFLYLYRTEAGANRWIPALRSRLLLGVPWGTLIGVAIVLVVYFVVQSGWNHPRNPVVIPFQSWSYGYPTGWLTAGFAHSGYNHLFNNVTSFLVLGTLAEYAFGHFPQRRGAVSFGSWWTHPYVRAFIIVPVAIVGLGLFSALFAIGPVIGFSGVVFAAAGFALIRYPLTTVLALFAISALRRLYQAIDTPVVSSGLVETGPTTPWWAEVAIQGHAIGLLAGALLGIVIFRRRGTLPSPTRLIVGVFLFAIAQNLWAVYWFEGTDRWVLYRGIGVVLVIALALLITAAVTSDDRPMLRGVTRRQLAVGLLAVGLALLIGPAIALNLITTDPGEATERPGIEVDDYRVVYAEGITNHMVAVVDVDIGGLGEVRTSGVIVYSEQRDIWVRAVSAASLADRDIAAIQLGDVGTRTTVFAERPAWSVVGNDSVYQVWLSAEGDRVLAFESPPSTADAIIANHTVTLTTEAGDFAVRVDHQGEHVATAPIPEAGEQAHFGDLTLVNDDGVLYAVHDGTAVAVASD